MPTPFSPISNPCSLAATPARRDRLHAGVARTDGFTLTELLAVIAIIGILAAIIIPTVGKMRESARASQCASNLRQVFNLYMMDVQENRGMTPPTEIIENGQRKTIGWINRIAAKYYGGAESMSITQIWGCPVQIDLKPGVVVNAATSKVFPLTYSMNRDLNRTLAAPGHTVRALASFASPPRTVLAGDGNDTDRNPSYYNSIIGSGNRPPETPHNNKANIVFLDGHVEAVGDQTLLNTSTPAVGTKQAMFWFGE